MDKDGRIPTTLRTETYELQGGGSVQVKRITKVKVEEIMGVAGLRDGDMRSTASFVRLVFQCAVVGATLDGYEFKQTRHPTLGMIAEVDLYERDEVTGDDVTAVMAMATRNLPAKPAGN